MNRQASILPILSVNFIGTPGYSIVMPFLIFRVTRFGSNSVIFGVLGATYSAFELIGAPILGKYSDIYGPKPVLLISPAGTLLAWLLFLAALVLPNIGFWEVESAWAGNFTLTLPLVDLFLGRALDGATGGNISVAVVQGPVMSYLSPKVSEKPLILAGSLNLFVSFALLRSHDINPVYGAAILFAIGNGIMWPSYLSLLGQMGAGGDQGYIQGIASSAGSLASIIGLVIGGILYGLYASTSCVIAAIVFIIVFGLAIRLPGGMAQAQSS